MNQEEEKEPAWPPEDLFPRRVAYFLRFLGDEIAPMGKISDIVDRLRNNFWGQEHEAPEGANGFTKAERQLAAVLMPVGPELDEMLRRRREFHIDRVSRAYKHRHDAQALYQAGIDERNALLSQVSALKNQVNALMALLPAEQKPEDDDTKGKT